jgi:hypothetical protein
MPVLVQQPGRIQIQRVSAGPGTEPLEPPTPERTEDREILARPSEVPEAAAKSRLTGNTLNGQQRSQHYVPAQMGHVSELFGPGQNPRQEPQGILEGLITPPPLFELGQHARQQLADAMPVQEAGKSQKTRATGNFLIREADLDGFVRSLELNELGHCLVSRFVGRLGEFYHTPTSLYQQ